MLSPLVGMWSVVMDTFVDRPPTPGLPAFPGQKLWNWPCASMGKSVDSSPHVHADVAGGSPAPTPVPGDGVTAQTEHWPGPAFRLWGRRRPCAFFVPQFPHL